MTTETEMQMWLDDLTISHLGCLVKYGSNGRLIFIDVPAKEEHLGLESKSEELSKIQPSFSPSRFSDVKVEKETDQVGNCKSSTPKKFVLKETTVVEDEEKTKKKEKKNKKNKKTKIKLNEPTQQTEKLQSKFDTRLQILDDLVSKMESPDRSSNRKIFFTRKQLYTEACLHRFSSDEEKRKPYGMSSMGFLSHQREPSEAAVSCDSSTGACPELKGEPLTQNDKENSDKVSSSLTEFSFRLGIKEKSVRRKHRKRMKLQGGLLSTVAEESSESLAKEELSNITKMTEIKEQASIGQQGVQSKKSVKDCETKETKRNKIKLPSLIGKKKVSITEPVNDKPRPDKGTKFFSRIPVMKNKLKPTAQQAKVPMPSSSGVVTKTPDRFHKIKLPSLTAIKKEKPHITTSESFGSEKLTQTKRKLFSRIPLMKNKVHPAELQNCPHLSKLSLPDCDTKKKKNKLPSLVRKKNEKPQIPSDKLRDNTTATFFSRIPIKKNQVQPAELKCPHLPKISSPIHTKVYNPITITYS